MPVLNVTRLKAICYLCSLQRKNNTEAGLLCISDSELHTISVYIYPTLKDQLLHVK